MFVLLTTCWRRATVALVQLRARALLGCRLLFAVLRLPLVDVEAVAEQIASGVRGNQLRPRRQPLEAATRPNGQSVLAVDIGGTRTKFLLVEGAVVTRLPPAPTAVIWQNDALEGADKFEPATAPRRMQAYLRTHGVDMQRIGRLAFSVPGTVDLTPGRVRDSGGDGGPASPHGHGSEGHTGSDGHGSEGHASERLEEAKMSIVKNTPSMSPRFRGFDFKEARRARRTHAP